MLLFYIYQIFTVNEHDTISAEVHIISYYVYISYNYVIHKKIITQSIANLPIVYPVKMEYECNFSISGLKMMMKSGLEKNNECFPNTYFVFFIFQVRQYTKSFC